MGKRCAKAARFKFGVVTDEEIVIWKQGRQRRSMRMDGEFGWSWEQVGSMAGWSEA